MGPERLDVDIAVSMDCHYCFGFKRDPEKKAYKIKIAEELARKGEVKETIDQNFEWVRLSKGAP